MILLDADVSINTTFFFLTESKSNNLTGAKYVVLSAHFAVRNHSAALLK